MKSFVAIFALVAALGMASAAPTRDLQSDLHEFVELIPIAEMREVAKRYIATDAEVQRALKYLQGPEWAELVQIVHDHPTWQEFKAFLLEAGINIDDIIAMIHDIISGAGKSANVHSTRGMREFIDELKALVPTDKLIALLGDKLSNSADFQEFWVKISGDKAHKMFDEIRALPEVQRVADVLREMGIDVDKVLDVIYTLFGWN
ncbi:protein G12 [Atheta coriaria]|uniref:protein G12 n=1 Tax=Dalotia coriaria TaxID=877792 RepID=UPI0031F34E24